MRPELYKVMIEALNPEEDLGVRLAASNALKQAIDDFQFNSEEFSLFLEPVFSLLFALLKEVNECDTKVQKELAFFSYILTIYLCIISYEIFYLLDARVICTIVYYRTRW